MFTNPKTEKVFLTFLLILAVFFVAVAYYYSQVRKLPLNTEVPEQMVAQTPEETGTAETVKLSPTLTPTPKAIPSGKRGFTVSISSNVKGPRIGRGELDPYDPVRNGNQKLTIEVNDTVPVESVTAILKTDNKTSPVYQLVPDTEGQLKGNWTGEWSVDDSYLYTYILTIEAQSVSGTSKVDITLR